MSSVMMLDMERSGQLLLHVIANRIPTILSYMSKNKWHVAKVVLTELDGPHLHVETTHSENKYQPINIQAGQPVGISFKYAYGKCVFDTTVMGLEPSLDPSKGGIFILRTPEQIAAIERRSYFRVCVPCALKVDVVMWHRLNRMAEGETHKYAQGRLVDLSAGGTQVAMPLQNGLGDRPDFRVGQFIGVKFTPLPYEQPLTFNAQIRTILPTADGTATCLGLQIVGLEASPDGRQTLSRIADIVDQYYQMAQTRSGRGQDGSVETFPVVERRSDL